MRSTRKMSTEEMNKLVLERVPLEERLRAVYLPIIAMDCACYLADDLLVVMGKAQLDSTKKISRTLRSSVEGYRSDNQRVMRSDLYKNLTNSTRGFYNSLSQDMLVHQIQYQQALLDRKLYFTEGVTKIVALSYIVRKIVRFVLELDRDFSKRISDLLGKEVTYTTEDNHHCVAMENALSQMLKVLDFENVGLDSLETYQTDMSFKVFKNKLNNVKI